MSEVPEGGPGRAEMERRIVSVLFADLVGFTPLSERLDAEDVATIQDAYFASVRETIARYGGVLEKFIGDAAMAIFGAPRSRDDDAERAVRAGLALVGAVEQLAARLGLGPGDLQLRVGINSGEVVHATAGPDAGRVTGDTVNTAARLQAAARPNTVLVGELTALAVGETIDLGDPEPTTLKGKADAVRAREAVGVRAQPSRDEVLGGLRAPLLGRDAELAQLEGIEDGLVAVVAPPGVGKSRLLAELATRAENRGTRILRARVRPQSATPYEGVIGLLASAGVPERLAEALDRSALSPARRAVVTAEVEGLLHPRADAASSIADLASERESRFAAWIDALDALTAGSPVTWIVEDVHWAGGDLLAFLGQAARAGAVRILTSARPSVLDTAAEWIREATVLQLDPLPRPGAGQLVRALVGDALPDETVAAIADRSDGNPLFIEELLRTWISVGTLIQGGDGWVLGVEPDAVSLPATVQAIYAAQLDDLPGDARMVARRASVAGRRFAVASLEALELGDQRDGLSTLSRRAFVVGPQHDPLAGDVYAYRHALLRDAGYASLARAERARLHVALARWIEGATTEGSFDSAEAVGGHYASALDSLPGIGPTAEAALDRASLAAAAARWLARASERAIELTAHDSAIRLLARSIELTSADDPLELAERRLRLGEVMAPIASLDRGIAEMDAALGLFAAHLPGARDGYARAAHALASAYMQKIRFAEAQQLTQRALDAIGPPDDAGTARLLALHAFARSALGERDGVGEEVERAEAIGEGCSDDAELALDLMMWRSAVAGEVDTVEPPDLSVLERRARSLGRWRTVSNAVRQRAAELAASDPHAALRVLDEADEISRTHGLTEPAGWAQYSRAETLLITGDWDRATASGDEAVELSERYGYFRLGFRTWMVLLPISAARGDPSRLGRFEAWWAAGQSNFPQKPSPYGEVLTAARLLWASAARGERPAPPALTLVPSTAEVDGGAHFLEALLTIAQAWLRAGGAHLDGARAVRDHARAALDGDDAPLITATADLLAAWVAHADGDRETAARHARSALAAAATVDATWWMLRAQHALDAAQQGPPSSEAAALEARLGVVVRP